MDFPDFVITSRVHLACVVISHFSMKSGLEFPGRL
jgi:hypothetical protein